MPRPRSAKPLIIEAELAQRAADPTVLHVTRAEDGYCGDMSCVRILDPHERKFVRWEDQGRVHADAILKNGVAVAELESAYGSNGRGTLARQSIIPLGSARIVWVEDWAKDA